MRGLRAPSPGLLLIVPTLLAWECSMHRSSGAHYCRFAPSPGLRPPSPGGRGFGCVLMQPADAPVCALSRPSATLSRGERVLLIVPTLERGNAACIAVLRPLPAFGHPLPGGEGLIASLCSLPMRPFAPSPGLRPPSPGGRGFDCVLMQPAGGVP